MRYEGPIYRPPSEADSLLVQATVGCPHNLCTFCMVYKDGVRFKVRPTGAIKADLDEAAATCGPGVRTLFFPAGNTIAMPAPALAEICRYASSLFPRLTRITVYGSTHYIRRKGPDQLKALAQAGLGRIHAGVESGDDAILTRIRKGATAQDHIEAGVLARAAERSTPTSSSASAARSAPSPRPGDRPGHQRHGAGGGAPQDLRAQNQHPPAGGRAGRPVSDAQPPPGHPGNHGAPHQPHRAYPFASDHYTNYLEVTGRLPEDRDAML